MTPTLPITVLSDPRQPERTGAWREPGAFQGTDTIQALRITDEETLVNVPRSTRPLSTTNANAAQVAFSPDGPLLAVTEKDTQTIDTYLVRSNGRAIGPNAQPSSGSTPFGFQFGPDGRLYGLVSLRLAARPERVAT